MKMIERWKAQPTYDKAVSLQYIVAIVFATLGFLFDSDFYLLIGVIIMMTVAIVTSGVVEIKRYMYDLYASTYEKLEEIGA